MTTSAAVEPNAPSKLPNALQKSAARLMRGVKTLARACTHGERLNRAVELVDLWHEDLRAQIGPSGKASKNLRRRLEFFRSDSWAPPFFAACPRPPRCLGQGCRLSRSRFADAERA